MAATPFATGDANTVKRWASETFHQALNATYLSSSMGTDDEAVIQVLSDLEENRGDVIKYDLLVDIAGEGVDGDAVLEGNTVNMTYHQDTVAIDQKRQGVLVQTMSQQRTVHDLRSDAQRKLVDWWAKRLDIWMFANLAGTAGLETGGVATTPESQPYIADQFDGWAGNAVYATPPTTHEVDATGGNLMLKHIDWAVEKAQTADPMVRPIMINGEPYYVLYLHNYQWTSLKTQTGNDLSWLTNAQQAGIRGDQNPVVTGSPGIYNNVILKVSQFIPRDATTGTAETYALLCGAQAGVIAFGNAYDKLDQTHFGKENLFSWMEQRTDLGNKKEIAGGAIFGMKRTIFNSKPYGVIRIKSDDIASG